MPLRSADFESAASTGSAIPAPVRQGRGNYNSPRMLVSEFDYALPAELIAQHPAPQRTASRLLHLDARGGLKDLVFEELPALVDARDTVVLNDTRVIKARLFGRKPSGGQGGAFLMCAARAPQARPAVRAGNAPQAG